MIDPVESPYLVPTDGSFEIARARTRPPKADVDEEKNETALEASTKRLAKLQRKLYADDRFSLLVVFQAMDAAGKDSTIRKVFSGVNPAGFQVFSFKKPSAEELDHDFLWRSNQRLPERGRIGVFNRSYYEEVLVVKVHPELLEYQKLPYEGTPEDIWEQRYDSIRDTERHLARNGTVVVKMFLHVSQEEQHRRFVRRIDKADKNWKFSAGDVEESRHWPAYQAAYEQALRATSRPGAPWYVIPADDKPFMRRTVADILTRTVESLPLRWPEPGEKDLAQMKKLRVELTGG